MSSSGLVLIADDDRAIRTVLSQALARAGFGLEDHRGSRRDYARRERARRSIAGSKKARAMR